MVGGKEALIRGMNQKRDLLNTIKDQAKQQGEEDILMTFGALEASLAFGIPFEVLDLLAQTGNMIALTAVPKEDDKTEVLVQYLVDDERSMPGLLDWLIQERVSWLRSKTAKRQMYFLIYATVQALDQNLPAGDFIEGLQQGAVDIDSTQASSLSELEELYINQKSLPEGDLEALQIIGAGIFHSLDKGTQQSWSNIRPQLMRSSYP